MEEARFVQSGTNTLVLVDLHRARQSGCLILQSAQASPYIVLVTRGASDRGIIPSYCLCGAFDLESRRWVPCGDAVPTPALAWSDGVAYPKPGGYLGALNRPHIQFTDRQGADGSFFRWTEEIAKFHHHQYSVRDFERKYAGVLTVGVG